DFDARIRKRYRIMALGDSFTFGWGVDIQQTWPSVLERELQKRRLDVDVTNLGEPGTYPAQYADIAAKAIPVLKPDLVLVAINHGDDLAQTLRTAAAPSEQGTDRTVRSHIKSAIKSIYPNLVKVTKNGSAKFAKRIEVSEAWKEQVATLL